ncbi:MAG: M18 family aminopeptidase [Lentisphaeraceae bacterium]|nr:M18 family aminopeptidase [Lentisphaeraceae bacterium]
MKNKSADSLLSFIDASPTPYHAVENLAAELKKKGALELKENADWKCEAGKFYYVIRNDWSIISFKIPAKFSLSGTAFNMISAHTDSPCLKLKPQSDKNAGNYLQWGVEIYGGVLLNSWLDRDLNLSGRISYIQKGELKHSFISITDKFFRVPQLAIHLDREANSGLTLNPETHMVPVLGLTDGKEGEVEKILLKKLGVKGLKADDISAMDLFLHDSLPGSYGGINDEFLYAPRLDNLAMSHAAMTALMSSKPKAKIDLVALFDHEEVGSESAQGACSNFLQSTMERIIIALGGSREDLMKAMPESYMVSADMAHALHPNYQDRHDDSNRPLMNKGPVIKTNARVRYATDSKSASKFILLCKKAKVPYQTFAGRNDIPCGSTVGPIVSTRLGVSTIDVGNPQLSMHSAREMAGADDHGMMIKVFEELLKE